MITLKEKLAASGWLAPLGHIFESEDYANLRKFLEEEYKTKRVYPSASKVLRALFLTPYDKLKVVQQLREKVSEMELVSLNIN